ncbi:modulator protein, partial [Yersinia pestis]|nr:modulator protein [Yersinia pestis]
QMQAIEVLQDVLPAGYASVASESKKRHRLLPVF